MTTQDEIMEGVENIRREALGDDCAGYLTDNILSYLHSQGVVIKVKCPDCEWSQFVDEESVGMTPCYSCNSTGYLIESLIKES